MATRSWPLFDLEVRTDEVTLRYIDDELGERMIDLILGGIHDPDEMPFAMPWTRAEPPELQRNAWRFWWRCRVEATPEEFRLPMAVLVDGEPVGATDLAATGFPTLRQFETGSWLALDYQGRGIGTALRRATLALGFDGLDAVLATTGAWEDNVASLGVTHKLGYTVQGHRRADREGAATRLLGFEMDRTRYEAIKPRALEFGGLDGVREFLEIATDTE